MNQEIDTVFYLVEALRAAMKAKADREILYAITTGIRAIVSTLETAWVNTSPPPGPTLVAEAVIRGAFQTSPATVDRRMYLLRVVTALNQEINLLNSSKDILSENPKKNA